MRKTKKRKLKKIIISPELKAKNREFNKAKKCVNKIINDLDAIIHLHDHLSVGADDEEEAMEWFHSFPIENLRESLDAEHGHESKKFTLGSIVEKGKLRRKFFEKQDELEIAVHKQNEAKIDCVLIKAKESLK